MVTAPLLNYYGGKWRIAPWVIEHMPDHEVYVEPFGGMASVLLRKPPSAVEVYNDLNDRVVDLFRCLRDQQATAKLCELVYLTPFSRVEFERSYEVIRTESDKGADLPTRVWRWLVYAHMAVGSAATSKRTGLAGWDARIYRANRTEISGAVAQVWDKLPQTIIDTARRLKNVMIEHRPWEDVVENYRSDGPKALFYFDPPYLTTMWHTYELEFNKADHEKMLGMCLKMDNMCMISGYNSELYMDTLSGWTLYTKNNINFLSEERTECLWLNKAAAEEKKFLATP